MKNEKFFLVVIATCFFFANFSKVHAESTYVLPYPGAMPGTLGYKAHSILESFEKYWYFGDFSEFRLNLKEADHYLVEAKTLFEYKQYLLAVQALEKSDLYFGKVYPALKKAQSNGKNIQEKKQILFEAAQKHKEIIEELKKNTPETFYWNPEKGMAQNLTIRSLLDRSIQSRLVTL